jgi:hypothetical protein
MRASLFTSASRRLLFLRTFSSSSSSSGAAPPPGAAANMRKGVVRIGAGVALLTVAPVFYFIGDVANKPLPENAKGLPGTWEHVDAKGDAFRLRFNKYNMAMYETPSSNVKGKVDFSAADAGSSGSSEGGSSSLTISPLVGFLGKPKRLTVQKWPEPGAAAASTIVVDGKTFTKVK